MANDGKVSLKPTHKLMVMFEMAPSCAIGQNSVVWRSDIASCVLPGALVVRCINGYYVQSILCC